MAGRRRARNAGKPLPPTARQARQQNRRARFALRFARATSERQKFAAAADYLRGAAARRQPDPARADRIIADATSAVIAAADQLLKLQAHEPLHPRALRPPA